MDSKHGESLQATVLQVCLKSKREPGPESGLLCQPILKGKRNGSNAASMETRGGWVVVNEGEQTRWGKVSNKLIL
jgi:hypothetical protein